MAQAIDVIKSIEGEGKILGLRMSYAFYLLYIFCFCMIGFILAEWIGLISEKAGLLVIIIPLLSYVLLRYRASKVLRAYALESKIARRIQYRVVRAEFFKIRRDGNT